MAKIHHKLKRTGKKSHHDDSFARIRFSKANLTIFAIIFAAIGGYFIYSSFAAALSASTEPENGTVTAPATVVNDATASGSKYVKFGTASTQSGTCLASNNCYPKPVNSGVGATGVPAGHTPTTGCTTSPASGAVLTDCLFTDGPNITTTGSGATYRFSEFRGQVTHSGSGTLTVEYSNLGPASGCQNYDNSFAGSNYTVRFSRFNTHVSEGPRDSGNNILIEENFIGPMCSNPGDHADGVQGYGGGTNIKILHNTFDMRTASDTTANVFIADDSKAANVENNLFMGAGYGLRLHNDTMDDSSLWTAIGNRFVSGSFGFGTFISSNITWTTNCSDNRNVTIDSSYNITSLGSVIGC